MNPNRAASNGAPVTVTLLGTGDAFSSYGRAQAGYLIDVPGNGGILLEAGPAVLTTLKQNGRTTNDFDFLIVSHLHGDHFGGLPFLLLEYMFETRRKKVLTIAGPPNLEERTLRMMATMFAHYAIDKLRPKLKWVVLKPGSSTRMGKYRVRAIRSPHTKPDISLSVRIDGAGKSVVFSGDSGWNDELAKLSDGADLFICECYAYAGKMTGHISWEILKPKIPELRAKRLMLTHMNPSVLARLDELKAAGVLVAADGLVFDL